MNISEWVIDKVRLDPKREPPLLIPGNRWGWLPDLFNLVGYTVGAEIGVSGGRFSKRLCKTMPGLKLYAIDPWENYAEQSSQWRMDRAYLKAVKALAPFDCEIIREYSAEAAVRFAPESLDFVYIDANRTFESVTEDLTIWSARVRSGGIVSGCCYYNYQDRALCQVKDAVDTWTREHGIDPWFVLVHHRYPAYFWVRP